MTPESPGITRGDALALGALSVLWTASCAFVGLDGEFPVSDGWAHAQSVLRLVETGEFVRSGWTWSPILTNAYLGAAFAEAFGFSFEALRWSSVSAGLAGTIGTYVLCRQLGALPHRAAFGAAVYGWNPIHFALSFTFMTDVVFSALCVGALVFGVRFLRTGRGLDGLGMGALTLAAVLSRQPGLALVAVFALAWMFRIRPSAKRVVGIGLALAGVGAASVVLPSLMAGEGDPGQRYTFVMFLERVILSPHAAYRLFGNGATAAVYLGAFLAPLAVGLAPRGGSNGWRAWAVVFGLAVGLVAALAWLGRPLPPGLDWIRDFGIGPIELDGMTSTPELSPAVWWVVIVAGAVSAGVVLVALQRCLVSAWSDPTQRADWVLLVGFATIPVVVLAIRVPFFDRYLLPSLPPLIAVLVASSGVVANPGRRIAAAALALVSGGFALLGTLGYFEHQRARSVLLDALVDAGVAPISIDGGNEFNGWHQFDLDEDIFLPRPGRRWVLDDVYVLGVAASRPGYSVIASQGYRNPLLGREESIFVLHRDAAGAPVALRFADGGRHPDVAPGAAFARTPWRAPAAQTVPTP